MHFLAGTLLAAAVLAPMLAVWYPRPLFEAAGSGRLPVFLALVAIGAGPLVAHLIARAAAPGAKSRRIRIALAQFVAIAGCGLALYVQRPVYLVFTADRFDLVLARDIDPRDLAKAQRPEFRRRPLGPAQYVAALQPADAAEGQRILADALEGGKDLQAYPQHYVPYAGEAKNALKRAKPLGLIRAKAPAAVDAYLAASGRAEASVGYLPLRARRRDGIVLLDAASGLPLEILLIDPW